MESEKELSPALQDEITALRAIYGDDVICRDESTSDAVFILQIPNAPARVRLSFASTYPDVCPCVLGTQGVRDAARKGDAAKVARLVVRVLDDVWRQGDVCLYDVIEQVRELAEESEEPEEDEETDVNIDIESGSKDESTLEFPLPAWTVSSTVSEKKSVFVAHCARVASAAQAKAYIELLINGNKKIEHATHNMSAWRIRQDVQDGGDNESSTITVQDCDDDGESAAGSRLLHLLQLSDSWNVVVIVSRWFGGILLGPDRFRIINNVARDALVKGGFIAEEVSKAKGKTKMNGKKHRR